MINYKRIAEFLLAQAEKMNDHNQFMKVQQKIDRVIMAWKNQYAI